MLAVGYTTFTPSLTVCPSADAVIKAVPAKSPYMEWKTPHQSVTTACSLGRFV